MTVLLTYSPAVPERGYTNKILWITLSSGSSTARIEDVDEKTRLDFQGGRGYAVKILYEHTTKDTQPLGPDNIFIIARGPMTGEPRWPGGTKTVVSALSPATNGYGEASVGGIAGSRLKYSGYDAICVTGTAEKPSVLVIDGISGNISLEADPGHEDSLALGRHLIDKHGKDVTGVFCIGIAGRNLVRFACVNAIAFNGHHYIPRQAGRTGMGAVMASKNIVAIVVIGKTIKDAVADDDALMDAGREMRKVIAANDKSQLDLFNKGTSGLVELVNAVNVLPVNNFSTSKSPEAEKISAAKFISDIFKKTQPCSPGCNLACGKLATAVLEDGTTVELDGPEYETIGMLGSNLGIWDANFVAEANYMCDVLGLDTISTGYLIGYLMECFEKGFITKDRIAGLDGLDPVFGNVSVARKLIRLIAKREGIGNVLAKGVLGTIEYVANGNPDTRREIEKFAVHSKGLEISAYIPRISIAQQVAYATSLIGAHHREAWLIFIDAIRHEIPTFEDKATILVWYQNIRTWTDIAGFCKLHWIDVRNPASDGPKNLATVDLYIKAINAVTGLDWPMEEYFKVAERAYNLAKLINIRRGLGRVDDHLPERAMGEVTMAEFDKLLDKYYEIRGWDYQGVPTSRKLVELGLN
nr:aldehyde ferredoxin oxidoreductase family protein [Candidatus Sigynarchaeota archaeon]